MSVAYKSGWTSFETALGHCAIAWTGDGFERFVLPCETAQDAEDALFLKLDKNREHRPAPPQQVADYIERIKRHLAGAPDHLRDFPVDLGHTTPFCQTIYKTLRTIDPGQTASYGQLAALAGKPGAARAVGRAMGANPLPLIIPCHRVLTSTGALGGFSAIGGVELKARLLEIERAGKGG